MSSTPNIYQFLGNFSVSYVNTNLYNSTYIRLVRRYFPLAEFQKFRYKSLAELQADIERLGLNIPTTENLSPLGQAVKVGKHTAQNAFAVLPMEGFDCKPNGAPSDLTHRRYMRYAEGGAGLVWFEACAVLHEGKSNPCQMGISEDSFAEIKSLVRDFNQTAQDTCGYKPLSILQLTHSGRYSRPDSFSVRKPIIVKHDPEFDLRVGIDETYPMATDEQLEALVPIYAKAAALAKDAGFDGVDIKTCHRYLLSELLSCYTRPGKFGGSLENRASLLLRIISEVRAAVGDDFIIASRFSVFDDHPYPVGFGACPERGYPCLDEPLRLTQMMVKAGIDLLSASGGDVFKGPHITRPFNQNVVGGSDPPEHPLEGVVRQMEFSRAVKKVCGNVPLIGTAYTWLREYLPNIGAAEIAAGNISMIGFGRGAFAYPDMPKDVLAGRANPKKYCIACTKCTQIMRDCGQIGCPVRDAEIYLPIYRKYRAEMEAKLALKK